MSIKLTCVDGRQLAGFLRRLGLDDKPECRYVNGVATFFATVLLSDVDINVRAPSGVDFVVVR